MPLSPYSGVRTYPQRVWMDRSAKPRRRSVELLSQGGGGGPTNGACAPWGEAGLCDAKAFGRAAGQSTRPNPTANFAGAERTTILSARPQHGRRRALPAPSAPSRPGAFHESTRWLRGQQFGAAAAVTGMIAITALSAAHADSSTFSAAKDLPSAAAAPAIQAAVTAEASAALAFDRPTVTSQPAPAPAPAPAVQAAGSVQAPAAPGSARESRGLRAPLASVNVSSPFGFRISPITGASGELHTGIDLTGACSTAVFAAGAGTVTEAGWSPYGGGNRIVVDHGNGLKTTYNHLASIGVSVGQSVAQGQQIAGVGTTGASTGCHLHFEVMVNGNTVDPSAYI